MRKREKVYILTEEQYENQNYNIIKLHNEKVIEKLIHQCLEYDQVKSYYNDLIQEVYYSLLSYPYYLFYEEKIDNFKSHIGYLKKIIIFVNNVITRKTFKNNNFISIDDIKK